MAYPVILFSYIRLECLRETIEHLAENHLAPETEVVVYSDGPKISSDLEKVARVRSYLKSCSDKRFKTFKIIESPVNKGLADSIIEGVSEVLNSFEAVIVLEDDLVSTKNFLNFMNQALQDYKSNSKVFAISGYTAPIKLPKGYFYDNYFTKRSSSWGWATWKDRWDPIDWDVSDYNNFKRNYRIQRKFNQMGSDMSQMLSKHIKGKIDSWAIRWCYHQFKCDTYTVFPTVSKISNVGFGVSATHTREISNRFVTALDKSEKTSFTFNSHVELETSIIKQFVKIYSLNTRIYFKIKNMVISVKKYF